MNRGKKKLLKKSLSQMADIIADMDTPQVRRLWSLCKAVTNRGYLYKVIEQSPLNETESDIFRSLCASVPSALFVRSLCWASLKGRGAVHGEDE